MTSNLGSGRRIAHYEVGQTLGSGMSAKVKLGRDINTGEQVALKLIDKSKTTERQLTQLYREVDAMKSLYHSNILNLKHLEMNAVYPKKNGTTRNVMLLALELASGGELFDFLMYTGAFSETIARTYFFQLVSALRCCHEHHIYHRDIKPENLLLDGHFQLKVADFGLSSVQERDGVTLHTECGTRSYMAPEVLAGQGYDGAQADVWSAGVVLFIMLAGNPPFQMANRKDWWFNAVSLGRYDRFWMAHLRTCPHFPEQAQALLNRIFVADPAARANIESILQDPWMAGDKLSAEDLFDELNRRKQRVDAEKAREREAAKAKKALQARAAPAGYNAFQRTVVRGTGESVEVEVPILPEGYQSARTMFYATEHPNQIFGQLEDVLRAIDASANITNKDCKLRSLVNVAGDRMELDGEAVELPGAQVALEVHLYRTEENGPFLVELQRRQGDVFAFDKLFRDVVNQLGDLVMTADSSARPQAIEILGTEQAAEEDLLTDNLGMI